MGVSLAAQQQEAPAPVAPKAPLVARPFSAQPLQRYDVLDSPEAADKKTPDTSVVVGDEPKRAADRLVTFLCRLFAVDTSGRAQGYVRTLQQGLLLARLPQPQMDVFNSAYEQLKVEEPIHARVQCSVLKLPAKVAAEHGVVPDKVVLVEQDTVVALSRTAQGGGALLNLPELELAPLWAANVSGSVGKKEVQRYALRAEMVPVQADQVALALDLTRTAAPVAGAAKVGAVTLIAKTATFAKGQTWIACAVEGEQATLLVVRVGELANKPLVERR